MIKKNIIFTISKCVKYLGTRTIFNRNELAYNTKEDDNIRRSMKNPSLLDHPFSFIKKALVNDILRNKYKKKILSSLYRSDSCVFDHRNYRIFCVLISILFSLRLITSVHSQERTNWQLTQGTGTLRIRKYLLKNKVK